MYIQYPRLYILISLHISSVEKNIKMRHIFFIGFSGSFCRLINLIDEKIEKETNRKRAYSTAWGISNLHLQQVPNPYLLRARRWWLRVNRNLTIAKNLKLKMTLKPRVYLSCIPVSTNVNGFPIGTLPKQVGLRDRWWSTGPTKNKQHLFSINSTYSQHGRVCSKEICKLPQDHPAYSRYCDIYKVKKLGK